MCTGTDTCVCSCGLRLEVTLSCHSSGSICLVFWDCHSLAWGPVSSSSLAAGRLRNLLSQAPQCWDYKCMPPHWFVCFDSTWIMRIELRSSYLWGKHFIDWVISPALGLIFLEQKGLVYRLGGLFYKVMWLRRMVSCKLFFVGVEVWGEIR